MNPVRYTPYTDNREHTSGPLFRDRETALGHEYRSKLADELEALANFQVTQERRDIWRHEAGLDGNGHGQLDYETGGTL